MTNLRPPSTLRTLVVGFAAFLAVAYLTFEITLWLRPTVTSSGHKVMALGHALIALVIGTAAALAAMIADYRWQRRP